MGDRDAAALNVRVHVRNDNAYRDDQAPVRFWRALTKEAHSNNDVPPGLFEHRLKENFGPALKQRLVNYFHSSWRGDDHRRDFPGRVITMDKADKQGVALSHVFFEARIRGYGSLDFAVDVAGARDLAALLDNNLDLLMMLMRAYIPQAFREATQLYGDTDAATFDITPSQELREAFEKPARRALPLPTSIGGREFAIWALTNGTLLPAVLLALAVCYVTYKGLADERAIIAANQQRVLAHQEALLKQANERAQQLAAMETKLLERAIAALPQTTTTQTTTAAPPPAPEP